MDWRLTFLITRISWLLHWSNLTITFGLPNTVHQTIFSSASKTKRQTFWSLKLWMGMKTLIQSRGCSTKPQTNSSTWLKPDSCSSQITISGWFGPWLLFLPWEQHGCHPVLLMEKAQKSMAGSLRGHAHSTRTTAVEAGVRLSQTPLGHVPSLALPLEPSGGGAAWGGVGVTVWEKVNKENELLRGKTREKEWGKERERER